MTRNRKPTKVKSNNTLLEIEGLIRKETNHKDNPDDLQMSLISV